MADYVPSAPQQRDQLWDVLKWQGKDPVSAPPRQAGVKIAPPPPHPAGMRVKIPQSRSSPAIANGGSRAQQQLPPLRADSAGKAADEDGRNRARPRARSRPNQESVDNSQKEFESLRLRLDVQEDNSRMLKEEIERLQSALEERSQKDEDHHLTGVREELALFRQKLDNIEAGQVKATQRQTEVHDGINESLKQAIDRLQVAQEETRVELDKSLRTIQERVNGALQKALADSPYQKLETALSDNERKMEELQESLNGFAQRLDECVPAEAHALLQARVEGGFDALMVRIETWQWAKELSDAASDSINNSFLQLLNEHSGALEDRINKLDYVSSKIKSSASV